MLIKRYVIHICQLLISKKHKHSSTGSHHDVLRSQRASTATFAWNFILKLSYRLKVLQKSSRAFFHSDFIELLCCFWQLVFSLFLSYFFSVNTFSPAASCSNIVKATWKLCTFRPLKCSLRVQRIHSSE